MSQQPSKSESGQLSGSPEMEELRQRAAAANAVLEKGLKELQGLEGEG